jgi:hypothetical protein
MSALTVLDRPAATHVDGWRIARVAPTGSVSARRRRPALLVGLVLVVLLITMVLGGSGAGAQLADPVAGHVVVAPGETLWDVAVATAPPGIDARAQVRAIQELNGIDGADLPAWSVLLLPAR